MGNFAQWTRTNDQCSRKVVQWTGIFVQWMRTNDQ